MTLPYTPPVAEMIFILEHVVGLSRAPKAADLDSETVQAILDEAAKLARDVLAPLNHTGDQTGCVLADGVVTTAPGFRDAYAQYRDGGWNAVPFSVAHGGQGLPWALAFAVQEMWQGANMAFGLCPLLNQGAVEALESHGSDAQKELYLEKLISGAWTGTMNLTEPQAGSDLSAIKTRAERQPDGTYRIFGQKIFITYGEHDYAENIVHLVLARLPGAPEGVRGISLFVVPKFLPDGSRNDVVCTGLEHKLGIHASPTCTMQYGDQGGAIGTLIGQENEGIRCMFTMMNNARLSVGLQGIAIAERAYQGALHYAQERVQGRDSAGAPAPIIHHPDVARMLMQMKALVETGRALTYEAAIYLDLARSGDAQAQARVDLLTPVVKAWGTDMAVDVCSTALQVFGGMGFIEEAGMAQYYRDARILPIYEGTNGIQANDLALRKIIKDGGAAARQWFAEIAALCEENANPTELQNFSADLLMALRTLEQANAALLSAGAAGRLDDIACIYTPYLKAFAIVSCGAMMLRMARAAAMLEGAGGSKTLLSEFYRTQILPQAAAWAGIARQGHFATAQVVSFCLK